MESAAGSQRQNHSQSQQQSKQLLHCWYFLSFLKSVFYFHIRRCKNQMGLQGPDTSALTDLGLQLEVAIRCPAFDHVHQNPDRILAQFLLGLDQRS